MIKPFFVIFVLILMCSSCQENVIIKPKAQLRLEYDKQSYERIVINCPYNFEKNKAAQLKLKENCWLNIEYPQLKATLYLTYRKIENNLRPLLQDAQKLTYDHAIKATSILEQPRIDTINKVYGMFYIINGNAATPSQFYVTDSVNHFVTGALYFNVKPNFDSIYPAIVYLREDVRRLMESIKWDKS